MNNKSSRVGAAEAVAREWNLHGLNYLVTHGLEAYPAALGRDLDILMDQAQAPQALLQASQILADLGWERIVSPPDLWGKRCVALREHNGRFDYLELHTTRPLRWTLLRFAGPQEPPDTTVGPFPVSAWTTFVKSVLLPLLANDVERFDSTYLSGVTGRGVTAELITDRTNPLLGAELASNLASTIATHDPEGLVVLQPALRRACVVWMLRHPVSSLRSLRDLANVKIRRMWSSSGIEVQLEIPHDADQQALLDSARTVLDDVFVHVKIQPTGVSAIRFWNQYQFLSRQGAIIQLTTGSTNTLRASAQRRFRLGSMRRDTATERLMEPGSERSAGLEIGRWIVGQWAHHMPNTNRTKPTA